VREPRRFPILALSNIVLAFSQLRPASPALFAAVQQILLSHPGGGPANLDTQGLVTTLHAFAIARQPAPGLFSAAVPQLKKRARNLHPLQIAKVLWAYSELGHHDEGLFSMLQPGITGRQYLLKPWGLAKVMQAYGRLGPQHGTAVLRALEDRLQLPEVAQALEPRHAPLIISGFAHAQAIPSEASMTAITSSLTHNLSDPTTARPSGRSLPTGCLLSADATADAAASLAELDAGSPELRKLLFDSLCGRAEELSPQAAARAIRAAAMFGLLNSVSLRLLADRLAGNGKEGVSVELLDDTDLAGLYLPELSLRCQGVVLSGLSPVVPEPLFRSSRRTWLRSSVVSDAFHAEVMDSLLELGFQTEPHWLSPDGLLVLDAKVTPLSSNSSASFALQLVRGASGTASTPSGEPKELGHSLLRRRVTQQLGWHPACLWEADWQAAGGLEERHRLLLDLLSHANPH